MWGGAFGPLQHYFLLDEAIAGRPRLVLVEVNLGRMSRQQVWSGFNYAALSRELSLPRAARVRAALGVEGVTLLDPWLYRLEERLDLLYVVPGIRARWDELLTTVGTGVNALLGVQTGFDPRAFEQLRSEARLRGLFAPEATDPAQVTALRALGTELREAGIPVLFYVAPVNSQSLAQARLLDGGALATHVESLRRAVGARPTEWLDLHAAVAAPQFRDFGGHMHRAGCEQIGRVIADAAGRLDAAGAGRAG